MITQGKVGTAEINGTLLEEKMTSLHEHKDILTKQYNIKFKNKEEIIYTYVLSTTTLINLQLLDNYVSQ